MPQRNLAVELLQKLLNGEIRTRGRRNVVQARSFSEMLEQALRKYQNRALETASHRGADPACLGHAAANAGRAAGAHR
jgi:type I site-specific restriction-modification system R (restriction) subunit